MAFVGGILLKHPSFDLILNIHIGMWFLEAVAFLKLQGYYCDGPIKLPLLYFSKILSLAFINIFGQ